MAAIAPLIRPAGAQLHFRHTSKERLDYWETRGAALSRD
jgi:hypothetical protein